MLMLMFFVIIFCADGIGINPAQTAGRWHSFTWSGLPSAAASGCNKCDFVSCELLRYIQMSHRSGNSEICVHVFWFVSVLVHLLCFLNSRFPAFSHSHLMKWYIIFLSLFSSLAAIFLPILHNHLHANEWILLFTASYCSCLSAWRPFERSNDFLRLLQ